MSEQRATYQIEPQQDGRQKPPPMSLTLNSEQVRSVIHRAAQRSPGLLVAETLKVLANHPGTLTMDLLSERDAQIIMLAIVTMYPNIAQKVIGEQENLQGS